MSNNLSNLTNREVLPNGWSKWNKIDAVQIETELIGRQKQDKVVLSRKNIE